MMGVKFSTVCCSQGWSQLCSYDVPFAELGVLNNRFINKWSQVQQVIDAVKQHQVTKSAYLSAALEGIKHDGGYGRLTIIPVYENQLAMILTSDSNIRFSKSVLIFAAQLLCVSPAAYRMIRSEGAMRLPREQLIRNLMSRSFNNKSSIKCTSSRTTFCEFVI